jgi:hypothetical protein
MEMPPGPPVVGPSSPPPAQEPGSPPPPDDSSGASPAGLLADEAANRRLVATTAALALVAVALMIGVLLMTRDGDGEDAAPEPDPLPTATVPVDGSPEPTGPTIDEAELNELVVELQAVVEEERGLEFREVVDLQLLEDEAYVERSRQDFDEDLVEGREDIENSAAALRAVGLWPEEGDPVDIVSQYLSVGSLGYYDPETGEMVVRGTADTPNLRITLVHELTHALEDQYFDLDRPELDDLPDESGFAFSALVEGSASRVEAVYTASLTEEERADAEAEQLEYLNGVDVSDFPPVLLEEQRFVYVTGAAFVQALYDDGGNAAVNRALRRPPTTSEQIQEPETWPERDPVVEVTAPSADGEVVEEGVVGQFLIHALASLSEDEPTPEWDGDNSVLWQDGDRDCLRMAVAGDLEALETGLTPWVEQVGAEMEVDGDRLVVTSCR